MTAVAEAPASTSTGPTARSVGRSARGPLLVIGALVVTAVLAAALSATGPKGRLDPGAYNPSGSHAIAQLLRSPLGAVGVPAGAVQRSSTSAGGDNSWPR